MERRTRVDIDTSTNGIPDTALLCRGCTEPDPHDRTRHHLQLLKAFGLERFRSHLTEQYVTLRDPGKRRQDTVDALLAWASNLLQQWSGMAHPVDGHPMPWWEARQWAMEHQDATAASAYNQAPEKYRAGQVPPGNLAPVVAQVTTHIRREPGDDDPMSI